MRIDGFCLLVTIMIATSCYHKQGGNIKANDGQKERIQKAIEYRSPMPSNNDSIILFFSEEKPFDTSWSLTIVNRNKSLKGFYTQTLPTFQRDRDDYLNDTLKLGFYELLSFEISNTKLKSIIKESGIDTFTKTDTTASPCIHCTLDFLYYDSKIVLTNSANVQNLNMVGYKLKGILLESILKYKRQRFYFDSSKNQSQSHS